MHNIEKTPYANLDPHLILDAVESVGYICSGTFHPLNSYENRVYQIGIENALPVIAKFYRPQRWTDESILEEHQFAFELVQHEIPVVAPLTINGQSLHYFKNYRFALFRRWGGRALELDNLDQLEWMGRFIGRLHAVGASKPFSHRLQLSVQTYGYDSFHFLKNNHFIPDYLMINYCKTVETLLAKIDNIFQAHADIKQLRIHGDLHAGNVLWDGNGPHIVDLDDCMTGPAIQDIWMLLSGDKSQIEMQLKRILDGYCEFHDFDFRELQLIEALRSLRMLNHSAWLAKRWDDPAFPLNFPWFNTPRYWQEQVQHLQEQVDLIDESTINIKCE